MFDDMTERRMRDAERRDETHLRRIIHEEFNKAIRRWMWTFIIGWWIGRIGYELIANGGHL